MWPKIIHHLQTRGYSQKKLAAAVGIDQATICRIADGRAPEPRYSGGVRLIELAGGVKALAAIGVEVPASYGGAACIDPGAPDPVQLAETVTAAAVISPELATIRASANADHGPEVNDLMAECAKAGLVERRSKARQAQDIAGTQTGTETACE